MDRRKSRAPSAAREIQEMNTCPKAAGVSMQAAMQYPWQKSQPEKSQAPRNPRYSPPSPPIITDSIPRRPFLNESADRRGMNCTSLVWSITIASGKSRIGD
jgi:hypothetical protein